jgi:hypothetical protein
MRGYVAKERGTSDDAQLSRRGGVVLIRVVVEGFGSQPIRCCSRGIPT